MSEGAVRTIECELCGEAFDPKAAGGWCTNPDCGEWMFEGATPDADTSADVAETDTAPDVSNADESEATDDVEATEDEEVEATEDEEVEATEDEEVEATEDEEVEATEDEDAAEGVATAGKAQHDVEADGATDSDSDVETVGVTSGASERGADDAESEDRGDSEDVAETDSDADEGSTTVECLDCGSEAPADANFCPGCGGDFTEPGSDDGEEQSVCPSCDVEVGPADDFCASCGENLDADRDSQELTACPDCDSDVNPVNSFCPDCGEDLDAHRGGDAGSTATPPTQTATKSANGSVGGAGEAPARLSLTAYGRSIEVDDGDAIGREVRALLAEAGRPDDEAVRIHREHVRLVREDGQFHLVDLGDNPTSINGTALSKGERESIAPGDEVGLSDVVTLTVETPDA